MHWHGRSLLGVRNMADQVVDQMVLPLVACWPDWGLTYSKWDLCYMGTLVRVEVVGWRLLESSRQGVGVLVALWQGAKNSVWENPTPKTTQAPLKIQHY